jgi:hypothetical protein
LACVWSLYNETCLIRAQNKPESYINRTPVYSEYKIWSEESSVVARFLCISYLPYLLACSLHIYVLQRHCILKCTKMLGQGLLKDSLVLSFKGCEKDINNLIKIILSRADSWREMVLIIQLCNIHHFFYYVFR